MKNTEQPAVIPIQLQQLIGQLMDCKKHLDTLSHLRSKSMSISTKTESEYLRLGHLLFSRAKKEGCIKRVIRDTGSARTYHKRIAAACHYVYAFIKHAANGAQELLSDESTDRISRQKRLSARVDNFVKHLPGICELLSEGFVGKRSPRLSKRVALAGLPVNWPQLVCEKAASGKYHLPSLILSATGCRPAELQRGVLFWIGRSGELQAECLFMQVKGVKVREEQGQPDRIIAYRTTCSDSIIQALIAHLDAAGKRNEGLVVSVESSGNFSKELVRLARILWPGHRHTISAICYRHQTAANVKKHNGGDAASRVLGHRSRKTRRNYGTAGQGRSAMVPDHVATTFPLKGFEPEHGANPKNGRESEKHNADEPEDTENS